MREKFERHCSGTDIIPADQRSFVYRTVIASDGKKAFNELIKVNIIALQFCKIFLFTYITFLTWSLTLILIRIHIQNCVQLFKQTDLQEEKNRILRAFSAIADVDLVDEALLFTQSVSIQQHHLQLSWLLVPIHHWVLCMKFALYNFYIIPFCHTLPTCDVLNIHSRLP